MAAYQEGMTPVFEEALRVCKPGAHLLCFGGTRTFHRMACAAEDAGWVVRDCVMWVYGSGFPKSMDVSKAIDKKLGATREVVGRSDRGSGPWNIKLANHGPGDTGIGMMDGSGRSFDVTAPATDEAREWEGWGTCLKPAWEPVIVARKPLAGTVAENVLAYGTGALNIDACRVPTRDDLSGGAYSAGEKAGPNRNACGEGLRNHCGRGYVQPEGRFPANLAHDGSPEVLSLFPQSRGQQGALRGTEPSRTGEHGIYGRFKDGRAPCEPRGDAGSAARFFYCAKASRRERGEGNDHPTVKPLALMEWLVQMATREGQLVLDPFAGSGTTLLACANLGRRCVGVERDPHYCEIARSRLSGPGPARR